MTEQMNLGGAWRMREADSETWHSAHVPGSVYADSMADGTMPDPFWRENELDAFERMKKDYVYQRTFTVTEAQLAHAHVELVCEGLDTLAHVSLNGREISFADNMHITWVWDVKEQLHTGENTLEIRFDSPILYCAKKAEEAAAKKPEKPEGIAQIGIDDFMNVELRTAQIVNCEKVPKAKKLLKLTLDLGYETRTVASGIAKFYAPEDLIGKKIIVVANLKPAVLCGIESNGMILASGEETVRVVFLDSATPLGERVR